VAAGGRLDRLLLVLSRNNQRRAVSQGAAYRTDKNGGARSRTCGVGEHSQWHVWIGGINAAFHFIDHYYLPWARTNKRSVANDEAACKVIKRFFAKKPLGRVAPFLVEKFKRERKLTPVGKKKQRERAPANVNRELEILSKIFTMAEDNGMVASNPCRKVNKLRQDNRITRYLTADEERRLMAALTGRRAYLKPIVVLALNKGMTR
jgi:hypothetical protein